MHPKTRQEFWWTSGNVNNGDEYFYTFVLFYYLLAMLEAHMKVIISVVQS